MELVEIICEHKRLTIKPETPVSEGGAKETKNALH